MGRSKLYCSIALTLLLAGCTDTAAPEASRFGRYTLRKVNSQDLPAEVTRTTVARLDFLRGELRLNSDFSFSDVTDLKVTPFKAGSIVTLSDTAAGTYRFAGDTVHFSSTRGERYYMRFQAAGSLTQELAESILTYRKATN